MTELSDQPYNSSFSLQSKTEDWIEIRKGGIKTGQSGFIFS